MRAGSGENALKVIVVGNGKVGKTSLITRFARGVYTEEYKKTIGVDFLEKKVYLKSAGEDLTLLLWDTAGQDEFEAITRSYYKGAGACLFVFSTEDRKSFDQIDSWHEKVKAECGDIVCALVKNKTDLSSNAAMNDGEVDALAGKLKIQLFRTSVKDDVNVKDVFEHVSTEFVKRAHDKAPGTNGAAAQAGEANGHGKQGGAVTAAPPQNKSCCVIS
mmetsp:Transcript_57720/g.162785  ORF Transcript_57720/g.162785 Transcript_57720/m.162785 type:complete len:217 (-) Transcript_57720:104-754(-)